MMICNSDTYNTDIRTSSKYDGDDWSFDADSQADEPGRYTYDDDQSEPCIGNCDVGHGNHVERHRKRPPRSAECRRGTSRIHKSGADPSRRQLTTQFSCDNDEYDDTSKRLSQRVERRRKFQDSPHVRRITNMRR